MKKILLIPSWYPTKENSLIGSFFEEQAKFLLSQGFDIRVLWITQALDKSPGGLFKKKFQDTIAFEKTDNAPVSFHGRQVVYDVHSKQGAIDALVKGFTEGWKKITEDGWQPDLLHAQATLNGGIIANKLSKIYNVPYCISEHIPMFFNNRDTYQDQEIVNALENASSVGVVSYHLLRHLSMQNVNMNTKVTWNFVDENRFIIAEGKRKENFRIVTIAYPEFIKDLRTFFKAVSNLGNLTSDKFEIFVVGNETYSESADASTKKSEVLAEEYKVKDKCTFIPYVARKEMPAFLAVADVLISTSISETFGMSVREAMMCGVPAISTRNGGAEDIINPKNGILVNIGDAEAIARNIMKIKSKEIIFDAETIRATAISQSGREAFVKTMREFFNCESKQFAALS